MRIVCGDGSAMLTFDRPIGVLRARAFDDVPRVLAAADTARRDGYYVAGYVTYEAGTALVPRQRPAVPSTLPFIEFGIFASPEPIRERAAGPSAYALGPLVPLLTSAEYARGIAAILARIREGDVYQVNFAVPFAFAFAGETRALYAELTREHAPPFRAYVESGDRAIVSCSPELFVRLSDPVANVATRLVTRPMKGTAPLADARALANAKNRAEHVMIVDLLRNDLHRLSANVDVERLFSVETYGTYATTTSTLAAERSEGFALADVFATMFPCGSVTGAPKVTAMHAVAEFERPRGAFCGSIGYVAPDGTGTWNVAIRTAVIDRVRGRGIVHIGGGIVADSKAHDEWAEILVKRRFIQRVAPPLSLLETMRRDPGGTYARLEAHLARLAGAADALHVPYDERAIREALARVDDAERAILVRLELDASGNATTSTRALDETPEVSLVWSNVRIDETDPLCGYKTTWRPAYDAAAREAASRGAFDALLCNRSDTVADGSRVSVFVAGADDRMLLTPPLVDGALAGILRAELIASGRARERRLTRDDVANATAIYVGNSARGLMRATLLR